MLPAATPPTAHLEPGEHRQHREDKLVIILLDLNACSLHAMGSLKGQAPGHVPDRRFQGV